MKTTSYLALLRGINVGGNNIIKMQDLKAFFEKQGFENVSTYIQSGNVLFTSAEQNLASLTEKIERALSKKFDYKATVVVVSHKNMKAAIKTAPKGFGKQPAKFRYDVIFLKAPLTGKVAIKKISIKEGVDEAKAGKQVLYFSRLISKATQSKLNKIVGTPIYKQMTIRNWNTTSKLLALMEAKS